MTGFRRIVVSNQNRLHIKLPKLTKNHQKLP